MAEQTIPTNSSINLCILCQYWSGTRRLNPQRNLITYEQLSKGVCIAPVGKGRSNLQMEAKASCSDFVLWRI